MRLGVLVGITVYGWPGLRRAALALEDGTVLFARSYQRFAFRDWFAEYAGYVAFGKNVLVSLLCRLPTTWIPQAFALSAMVLAAMPALCLLHPAWERMAPRRAWRLAALALAWLPLGNYALITVLDFTNANLLVWLCLLLLRPADAERPRAYRAAFEALLVFVLTWSHPLAFLTLPIAARWLWRGERRLVAGSCLIALVTYQLLPRSGAPVLYGQQMLEEVLPYLSVRVVFEVVCGTAAKGWLFERHLGWVAIGAGGLLTAGLLCGLRRVSRSWGGETRRFVVLLPTTGALLVVASLLLRAPLTSADLWGQRYVLLARCSLVVVAVLMLERLLGWRWLAALLVGLSLLTGLWNRDFYRAARPSPEFVQFLHHLAAEEQRLGDRRGIDAHLERGDWPIHITPK